MNKSTPSEIPNYNLNSCKVIIDNCSHTKSLGIDFKKLKSSLSDISSDIVVSKSICTSPNKLAELLKNSGAKFFLVIGYGDYEHTKKYREIDQIHFPPSIIQVIDIRLLDVYKNNNDAFKQTVKINALKVSHALDIPLERIHKPFKLSESVSRRNLFRAASATLEEYSDIPAYQSRFCLPFIDSCTHCLDACPYEAVVKEKTGITIIDKSCVRCGACCSDCPTGALQLPDLLDSQLIAINEYIASASKDKTVSRLLFTCQQGIEEISKKKDFLPKDVGVIKIPCIAVFGFLQYLIAASFRINTLLLCPNELCNLKQTLNYTKSASILVNKILKAAKTTYPTPNLIEADKIDNAMILLKKSLESQNQISSKKPELDKRSKRGLLNSALSKIAPEVDTRFEEVGSLFFDISINNDDCTLCDACSRVCQANAIKQVPVDLSEELTFWYRRCVGCYACEKICPEDCLDMKRRFIPKNIIDNITEVKIKDSVANCKKCGESLGPYRKIQKIEKILAKKGNTRLTNMLYLCRNCK